MEGKHLVSWTISISVQWQKQFGTFLTGYLQTTLSSYLTALITGHSNDIYCMQIYNWLNILITMFWLLLSDGQIELHWVQE